MVINVVSGTVDVEEGVPERPLLAYVSTVRPGAADVAFAAATRSRTHFQTIGLVELDLQLASSSKSKCRTAQLWLADSF